MHGNVRVKCASKETRKKKEDVDNVMKRLHPHTQQHTEKPGRVELFWADRELPISFTTIGSYRMGHNTKWSCMDSILGGQGDYFSKERDERRRCVGKPALDSKHTAQCGVA
jgi:hypothetical protein